VIGTGLRWECMKRDQFKRSIAMIRKERRYLMEAFTSRGFYPHESAVNFILVDISSTGMDSHEMTERLAGNRVLVRDCAMFQGPDGWYIRGGAGRTREEKQRLMQDV